MSWWNPLSWGKGSEKVAENILDKDNGLLTQVGGWIGNMDYTEEEKAKFTERLNEGVSGFVEMTLAENTERSKARREVAIMWVKIHLFMILVNLVAVVVDEIMKTTLSQAMSEIVFGTLMTSGTLSVLAFFFGSHMISSHIMGKGKTKK